MLKSNEWYTQARYIQAVKEVLGGIDLDPASCLEANETVQATNYFCKEEDGLALPWFGRVFLNPPYSTEDAAKGMEPGRVKKAVIMQWIEKLIEEYEGGYVEEAILLTKADVKQKWFQLLWDYPICIVRSRMMFDRPGLPPEKHQFGTAFVYFGDNQGKFLEVFGEFGPIIRPEAVYRKAS